MEQVERDYYLRVWGFDPDKERKGLDSGASCYESEFPLDHDPYLHAAGVTIWARVDFNEAGSSNRILFKCQGKVGSVTCVHTVVCAIDPSADLNDVVLNGNVWALDGRPAELTPEEHFVALRSYVAALAEEGIGALFHACYTNELWKATDLPFGFNSHMQKQIMAALETVAPQATTALVQDFLGALFETVPLKWIISRMNLLNETLGLRRAVSQNPQILAELEKSFSGRDLLALLHHFGGSKDVLLQGLIAANVTLAEELLRAVVHDVLKETVERRFPMAIDRVKGYLNMRKILTRIAQERDLPEEVLRALVPCTLWQVRAAVAHHPNLPEDIIQALFRDEEWQVRLGLTKQPMLSGEVLAALARDPSQFVRVGIARRLNLPEHIRQHLEQDVVKEVRECAAGIHKHAGNKTPQDPVLVGAFFSTVFGD